MKTLLLLLFLFLNTLVYANTVVGKIVALKGSAQIVQGNLSKNAVLGSQLYKSDQIITHDNTKVQVIFQDETVVSIGKNTQFSIDEYVSEGAEATAKMSLFKGAVRTITGKIGKANPEKFQLKTKTATIGIRGTNFVVISEPASHDIAACTQGAIFVTAQGGQVDVMSGFMTQINAAGEIQSPQPFSPQQLQQLLNRGFGPSDNSAPLSAPLIRSENLDDLIPAPAPSEQISEILQEQITTDVTDSVEDQGHYNYYPYQDYPY
jgi:hypothetical protein